MPFEAETFKSLQASGHLIDIQDDERNVTACATNGEGIHRDCTRPGNAVLSKHFNISNDAKGLPFIRKTAHGSKWNDECPALWYGDQSSQVTNPPTLIDCPTGAGMSMMQVYVTLDQYNWMAGESLVSLFAYGAKNVRYTGSVSIIKLASVLGVNALIGTKVRQRGLEMVTCTLFKAAASTDDVIYVAQPVGKTPFRFEKLGAAANEDPLALLIGDDNDSVSAVVTIADRICVVTAMVDRVNKRATEGGVHPMLSPTVFVPTDANIGQTLSNDRRAHIWTGKLFKNIDELMHQKKFEDAVSFEDLKLEIDLPNGIVIPVTITNGGHMNSNWWDDKRRTFKNLHATILPFKGVDINPSQWEELESIKKMWNGPFADGLHTITEVYKRMQKFLIDVSPDCYGKFVGESVAEINKRRKDAINACNLTPLPKKFKAGARMYYAMQELTLGCTGEKMKKVLMTAAKLLPHERTDNNPFYGKTNVVVRQHVLNDETKLLQAFVVYYQLPPIEDGEEDTITELTDIFEC